MKSRTIRWCLCGTFYVALEDRLTDAAIEELRTVAAPGVAEAQIESVTVEAAGQVAGTSARTSRAEQQQAALAATQHELGDRAHALDQVTAELVAVGAAAEAQNAQALAQLTTVRTRLRDAEHDRADDEAARAQRAEADLANVRDERGRARIVHDSLREEASSLRGNLATTIAERDTARTTARRE